MKTILADSVQETLTSLRFRCEKHSAIQLEKTFSSGEEVLDYIKDQDMPDLIITDTKLSGINGIELGIKLRELSPNLIIIYITDELFRAADAMVKVKADAFLEKSCTEQELEWALNNAVLLSARNRKKIEVRTFGRFCIFVNGEVVVFKNDKAKELLALCVDHRGGRVTIEEAVDKLWPDKPYDERSKRLYRKAVSSIHSTLRQNGISYFFFNKYGCCAIRPDKACCDYFEFLKDPERNFDFNGAYMFDYNWGEDTNGELIALQSKRRK